MLLLIKTFGYMKIQEKLASMGKNGDRTRKSQEMGMMNHAARKMMLSFVEEM